MKKKVLVKGPFLTVSGYSEHANFVLRSLRSYEDVFDIYAIPTNWGQCGWKWEDDKERSWLDSIIQKTAQYNNSGGKYDIFVQVSIPNEIEQIAPVNILCTAGIEVDKVSPVWIDKSRFVNKIITVSNFAKQVFQNSSCEARNNQTGEIVKDFKCTTPIEVVSYPIKTFEPAKIDLDLECNFNFLTICQWSVRKNVENTIKWFVEEFHDKNVGLVVKTFIKSNSVIDRYYTEERLQNLLQNYPNRQCKVVLLHGYMNDAELTTLYNHPKIKAFVNLAHGEGFSLSLFEAVYNGLPVITTNWGGQTDFLYMSEKSKQTGKIKNKEMFANVEFELKDIQPEAVWPGVLEKGTKWAFPKEGSYKTVLRDVYHNYNKFKQQSLKLKEYVLENFNEKKQYKEMVEQILGDKIITVDREDLPGISMITSVFRGKDYIEKFFEDIERQTIFDKCELVLVHPKTSPDFQFEQEIIHKYTHIYPKNIIYKVLEEDATIYKCWNEGVKLSTKELISNSNLDDRKAVNQLERFSRELYLNNDIDLVYCDYLITEVPNETFEHNSSEGRRYSFPEFSYDILKMMNLAHASPCWRKSLHDKYGYFIEEYKSVSDWEAWLRFAQKGCKFKKINELLGLYYFSPVGISTSKENFQSKIVEEKEVFLKYKNLEVENK